MLSGSVVDGESEDDADDAADSTEEGSDAASASAGTGTDEGGSCGCVMMIVEAPRIWHASWDAWQTYLTGYCARTMQVVPVKETMPRAERNRRLKWTKKGDDESQLVPEKVDPYQRTYICTHGWKKRTSRSGGSRPRQHIWLTNCPFCFVVQVNSSKDELQVKNGCFRHNHPVCAAAFATYRSSRGVDNALVGARVDGKLAVGAKRSRIYDYLLEHHLNVIQVDADNMVRLHSSSVSAADDNDATTREIAVFAAADSENASPVTETESEETGVISLATAHLRRIFGRFSEILIMDCSHKTNSYNYQLLTFMEVHATYISAKDLFVSVRNHWFGRTLL